MNYMITERKKTKKTTKTIRRHVSRDWAGSFQSSTLQSYYRAGRGSQRRMRGPTGTLKGQQHSPCRNHSSLAFFLNLRVLITLSVKHVFVLRHRALGVAALDVAARGGAGEPGTGEVCRA